MTHRLAWRSSLTALLTAACFACSGGDPVPDASSKEERTKLSLLDSYRDQSKVVFVSHVGSTPFSTYLAKPLRFDEFDRLRQSLEVHIGRKLKHRGEAHITVITPPEFDALLDGVIPMHAIEAEVDAALTRASFEPVCVGRGRVSDAGEILETYYLVVQSEELLAIRAQIFRAYRRAGGEPSLFDPNAYYPHVTLGFTVRDLHESDGVRKGHNSCFVDVQVVSAGP